MRFGTSRTTSASTAATRTRSRDLIATPEQALAYLSEVLGSPVSAGYSEQAARRAIRKTHPDHGGSEFAFRKVIRAREVLGLP
jgi:hypothetical protein